MIFVTVGAQLPFDRLIKAVDVWAGQHRDTEVFAQTGKGKYRPVYIEYSEFLSPAEFDSRVDAADFLIGHAGMGTIITAIEYAKPLLVMPRDAALGEHRNNHQMDTVKHFAPRQHFNIAYNEKDVGGQIDILLENCKKYTPKTLSGSVSSNLIKTISDFIECK